MIKKGTRVIYDGSDSYSNEKGLKQGDVGIVTKEQKDKQPLVFWDRLQKEWFVHDKFLIVVDQPLKQTRGIQQGQTVRTKIEMNEDIVKGSIGYVRNTHDRAFVRVDFRGTMQRCKRSKLEVVE